MSTAKHVQLNTRCFSLLLYVSPSICITLYISPIYISPIYISPIYISPMYISPIYISPYISYLQARFGDVIVSHGGQTQCPCLQLQLHSLAQYGADDKGLTGPVFHNLYASCINVSFCCITVTAAVDLEARTCPNRSICPWGSYSICKDA